MSRLRLFLTLTFLLTPAMSLAKPKKVDQRKNGGQSAPTTEDKKVGEGPSVDADEDKDEASNKFDFDAATLEGKMKAPPGMMLKGRVEQNKNQMVQLRKNFRAELKKSTAANRAIKPKD